MLVYCQMVIMKWSTCVRLPNQEWETQKLTLTVASSRGADALAYCAMMLWADCYMSHSFACIYIYMFAHVQYVYKPYMIYIYIYTPITSYGSLWCIFSSLILLQVLLLILKSCSHLRSEGSVERLEIGRKALTYCRSNIQRPNNVKFGCVKRNYILYIL